MICITTVYLCVCGARLFIWVYYMCVIIVEVDTIEHRMFNHFSHILSTPGWLHVHTNSMEGSHPPQKCMLSLFNL